MKICSHNFSNCNSSNCNGSNSNDSDSKNVMQGLNLFLVSNLREEQRVLLKLCM